MERDKIQQESAKEINKNFAVLLEYGTGVGKTKIALDACNGYKTLIVYKQKPHYDNWLKEIDKWSIDSSLFTFTTYNSLHKHIDSYEYLIFDEAHAITKAKVPFIKQINTNKIIYLSATVEYDKKILLNDISRYKILKYSLQNAIDENVLPEPVIYIHTTELDNTLANCVYERIRKADKTVLSIMYADRYNYLSRKGIGLKIQCTQKQYYELLCNDIDFWKDKYMTSTGNFKIVAKNMWLNKASKRKMWLNSLKTSKAKQILKSLGNKRLLIFASTINQCNELADSYEIDYPRVHSKRKNNQETVDRFNSGSIDRLYNCSVLNEGMNLSQLDACLIVGVDGKELSTVQRIGRSIRSTEPQIHIIELSNTRDAEYVDNIKSKYEKVIYVY